MAYKMPGNQKKIHNTISIHNGVVAPSFMNTANGGKKSAELVWAMVHYKSEGLHDVLAV